MEMQIEGCVEKDTENEVREILWQYPFRAPEAVFWRRNENEVFLVRDGERQYVLRIQRPAEGFSLGVLQGEMGAAAYLEGELRLLEYLKNTAGMRLQEVVPNKKGEWISFTRSGRAASVLTWISGRPLDRFGLDEKRCQQAGYAAAQLHKMLRSCRMAGRYRYGEEMLTRVEKEIFRAAQTNNLTKVCADTVLRAIEKLQTVLPQEGEQMIHADLTPSNLLNTAHGIIPIDFSLAGYGRPEMDLASFALVVPEETLRRAFLYGYLSGGAPPDEILLEGCCVFQAAIYLACQHEKYKRLGLLPAVEEKWCTRIFGPFLVGKRLF